MTSYQDSPEESAFRLDLRRWLESNAIMQAEFDSVERKDRRPIAREWHRRLYEGGYIGMTWAPEYGGRGLTSIYDAILCQEVGDFGAAPLPPYTNFVGKLIYRYGTEKQIARFLAPVQRGDEVWCQGFSEPGAGSDLASLRTRADRDGDVYVINGQKLWTSGSDFADWCFLLARTDQDSQKHSGISCFLVDMKTPGIVVQPVLLASERESSFTVFWDNVSIPAENRLGEENRGWRIAVSILSDERGPENVRVVAHYRKQMAALVDLIRDRDLTGDRAIQREVGRAYADGEAHRLFVNDLLSAIDNGSATGMEGSVAKLLWTRETQNVHQVAMDILGPSAIAGDHDQWFKDYLWARVASVYGGTSQIQRNIIAQRVLGMPR